MTDISVILVTKNAQPFIADAIRQALACQSKHGAEVVAIDAGSTDGTWEALSVNDGWKLHRQKGDGLAGARNQGLASAQGEFIAFLDADDAWLPGKMIRQREALDAAPEIDVVSCLLKKIGIDDDDVLHPAWTPSGCLFRRRAFDRVGLFSARYQIACDHDWFMRARKRGLKMAALDALLLHKRIHAENLSHDRGRYRKELLHIFRNLS